MNLNMIKTIVSIIGFLSFAIISIKLDQELQVFNCETKNNIEILKRNCRDLNLKIQKVEKQVVNLIIYEGSGGLEPIEVKIYQTGEKTSTCENGPFCSLKESSSLTVDNIPATDLTKHLPRETEVRYPCELTINCREVSNSILWYSMTKSTFIYNIGKKELIVGTRTCSSSPCYIDKSSYQWEYTPKPIVTKNLECYLARESIMCESTKMSYVLYQRGDNPLECYTQTGDLCVHDVSNLTISLPNQQLPLDAIWTSKQYSSDFVQEYLFLLDQQITDRKCVEANLRYDMLLMNVDLLADTLGVNSARNRLYQQTCYSSTIDNLDYIEDTYDFITKVNNVTLYINPVTLEVDNKRWLHEKSELFINLTHYYTVVNKAILMRESELMYFSVDDLQTKLPDIKRISQADVIKWVQSYDRPINPVVEISGNLTKVNDQLISLQIGSSSTPGWVQTVFISLIVSIILSLIQLIYNNRNK